MDRISYKKALEEIEKFKNKRFPNQLQCYEPTLSDVVRLYQQLANYNPGDKAAVLEEAFGFLAQEPIMTDYREGKLYIRPELSSYKNESDKNKRDYCNLIKVLFIREKDKFALDGSYEPDYETFEYDTKLKYFLSEIKEQLSGPIKLKDLYNKLIEKAKDGYSPDTLDLIDIEEDEYDVITDKEKKLLERFTIKTVE